MMESDNHPSPSIIDDRFNSMVIPGIEGVAVCRSTIGYGKCVAIGRDLHGICRRRISTGNPYAITGSVVIPAETFYRAQSLLEGKFKKNGMIWEEDILDGTSYLVKWVSPENVIRLLIGSPDLLSSDEQERVADVREFATRLDRFLKEGSPTLFQRFLKKFF